MRNFRKVTGALVLAVMIAAVLATATPASADTGAPGGPRRGTCGFLQGILYKIGNEEAAAKVASIFETLFGCDFDS
jgi:hypothetical protein